jgi:hypothetical protein
VSVDKLTADVLLDLLHALGRCGVPRVAEYHMRVRVRETLGWGAMRPYGRVLRALCETGIVRRLPARRGDCGPKYGLRYRVNPPCRIPHPAV